MKKFLHQFFLPHELNNFRPKFLHHRFLAFFVVMFLSLQIGVMQLKTTVPTVLGVTTDLSVNRILSLTNKDRQENGLDNLVLNDKLTQAAQAKGEYMFAKNFWAHNAPDGTTPWYFIHQANYDYVYAGENLARGFTDSDSVVSAWMASPTHRENMLSPNYHDVGFAILEGNLLGEHTSLVVEMFGNTQAMPLAKEREKNMQTNSPNEQTLAGQQVPTILKNNPVIDAGRAAWYIGVGTLSLFVVILLVDMIIIERRKIVRFVGHNTDHILFLSFILFFILLVKEGGIL